MLVGVGITFEDERQSPSAPSLACGWADLASERFDELDEELER